MKASKDKIEFPTDLTALFAGFTDPAFSREILRQLLHTLCLSSLPEDEQQERTASAFAALKGIGPRNELEAMLAAQTVATHFTVMECLRVAAMGSAQRPPMSPEVALGYALKFMTMYPRQMEALDKHRANASSEPRAPLTAMRNPIIRVERVIVDPRPHLIEGDGTEDIAEVAWEQTDPTDGADAPAPAPTHDPASFAPQFDMAEVSGIEAERTGKKS